MKCQHCGATIPDSLSVCEFCGCAVDAPRPAEQTQAGAQTQPRQQAAPQPQTVQGDAQEKLQPQPVLQQPHIFPLGLASYFTMLIPIVGLPLAIIAFVKGKKFIKRGGVLEGKALSGYKFSIITFGFSPFFILFWLIVIFLG